MAEIDPAVNKPSHYLCNHASSCPACKRVNQITSEALAQRDEEIAALKAENKRLQDEVAADCPIHYAPDLEEIERLKAELKKLKEKFHDLDKKFGKERDDYARGYSAKHRRLEALLAKYRKIIKCGKLVIENIFKQEKYLGESITWDGRAYLKEAEIVLESERGASE